MIVVNGSAYVVDCGDGVARQLAIAGVALPTLRHIFVTHQHSDHNADYGNLMLLAWTAGLRTRVDTWGPPPLIDQQNGGGIAWSIGELPTIALAITVAIQWSRSDTREQKRVDRNADRTDDAELKEYNDQLARLSGRD